MLCNQCKKGVKITKKLDNRLLFTLCVLILILFSVSCVSAQDNETASDLISVPADSVDVDQVQSSQVDEPVLEATDNAIKIINVKHHYNETANTWDEEGYALKDATVKLYDSNNNLVSTHKTDSKGSVVIKNLKSTKYHVEVSYADYETQSSGILDFTKKSGTLEGSFDFIPDILLLVDYTSHKEKINVLMNMSKRVAYIDVRNYDSSREWLVENAKFIHIDMFAEGSYTAFTAEKLKQLLAVAPANANYNVAYTFGVYSDSILNSTGLHIVGASSNNNTYHTIENTYIGSYFQAEDINSSDVLYHNMENYLKYVYYLINPSKYENPTLDDANAPQMGAECGFYHPDLGVYTISPEGSLINQWIKKNPGYNCDGKGSLYWMVQDYSDWFEEVLDPTSLFEQFEYDFIEKFDPDTKFIAIVTYYCGGDVVDSLIRGFEDVGRPAFNIFKFSTNPSMSSILNKINNISKVGISSMVSLYSWSLSYANGTAESDLSDINVEILKGVNEISQSSYESTLGPQTEWTYSVTYPSFEGVFSPVILSYVDDNGKVHVIQSGVDKMVQLSSKWADLKDLENSEKVIAIVLYNYPAGKAEIGASYLDVVQSTYDLILKLYEAGYTTCNISELMNITEFSDLLFDNGNKGSWAGGVLKEYVERNWDSLVEHHQLISMDDFINLTDDLSDSLYEQMVTQWGAGLGKCMVYTADDGQQYLVIPGFWLGNIFITYQPSRGWEEANVTEVVEDYHDLTLAPHQQYVAFYEWLDKVAGVNAIVSMGTHGTLEWLPGKTLGVGEGDWSFELTKIPTIYPYIVSNPGEAMVARDRSSAMVITHMTPAIVNSELYGNYSVLNNYITSYKDQMKLNVTSNAEVYREKILKLAPSLGFRNMSEGESFDDWLDELHLYLENMADDFITYGLHTLGKVLTGDELSGEVVTIVTSQTKIYNQIMEFLYPELKGKDFYSDIQSDVNYLTERHAIEAFMQNIADELVNGSSVDELADKLGIDKNSSLYNSISYAAQVIVNIQNNNEWNAILTALSGGYVEAGLLADPAYGDSIPTGYDGYASDSTKMPSKAAYESAVKIVDLLLSEYYEEHGEWPEMTALILWGTEISRTEGIGIAEFLYLLGCQPVWSENGKVIGVELLPLENLTVTLSNGSVVNRPRIDVYASTVTSNKDWITWMVTATRLAANANETEEDNYVIKHYNENPTLDRIFGLSGNVLEGTGMSTLIPSTSEWNISTVNEVGMNTYLDTVSFAWTIDEDGNIQISKQKDTYEYLLKKTDLITQNLDSTWRILDSDDYYDWFGGLYNAASILRERDGLSRPDTSFVDIRDKNRYVARSYEDEMEFELRTTLLNPKYLEPLKGTAAGMNWIASRMQNTFGLLTVSNNKLNTELGNQMTDTLLGLQSSVTSASTSVGLQSSLAHMFYLGTQGTWAADSKTLQKIADAYMQQVLQYGVACCHHTCKNLDFNMKIIQASSLTAAQKAQFAKILAEATNTDPLYEMDEKDSTTDDNKNAQELGNGTNAEKQSSSSSGGKTSAGQDASQTGDAKSASQSDASSSSSGESGANAYELSQQSASKSAASSESSMPIFVIIAIIILIAIFLVGYVRDQKDEDYDDY